MKKQQKQMKEMIPIFIAGLIIGILLAGFVGWNMMPGLMIHVKESKLGFDETISAINASAAETNSWKIPIIHELSESLVKAGHDDMTKLSVVELCQPHHAYEVLKKEENRKISAIMPCRASVFEDDDGNVFIAEMNTKLLSKMFGKDVAKVMGIVAEEQEAMFKDIILE